MPWTAPYWPLQVPLKLHHVTLMCCFSHFASCLWLIFIFLYLFMRRPLATNHAHSAKKQIIQYHITSLRAPPVVQPLICIAGISFSCSKFTVFKICMMDSKNSNQENKPTTNILSFVSGQQRSRMLATLFKDERCQQLATYGILEKMYLDRIIRGNQLQEFAAMLMPHQKATTADGESEWLVLHSVHITKCSPHYCVNWS